VPEAILDNSAYARLARHASVREAVLDYLNGPLNTLRSVLVQRLEICTSVRNVAEFDAEMQALAAMPLLEDALPAVGAAAQSLQRALVQRGTHRGPKVVDLLIAATALVNDAEILHYDGDYDLLAAAEPRLRTRWIVPRGSVA
jgi:predicted nucleic acid-binding protein